MAVGDMNSVGGGTSTQRTAYTQSQVEQMAKEAGLNEKGVEVVKKAFEILGKTNVTVTNKLENPADVGKPNGATGLPELDDPDSLSNRLAALEKLVAYLQLDSEKEQLETAKERIEINKETLERERANRDQKLAESLKAMDDAAKAAKANRIFSWLGAALAVVAAVLVTVATGGVAAGFAIAGAIVAVGSAVCSETGLTEKLIDAVAKAFEDSGSSKNDAKLKAALVVNLSIMALGLICSGGSMVGGMVSAGKAVTDVVKLAQNVMTIVNTGTGLAGLISSGVNTAFQYEAGMAEAASTEAEKALQAIMQRLQESEEELNDLVEQLEASLGDLAELLNSVTNTSDEIANNIGNMA